LKQGGLCTDKAKRIQCLVLDVDGVLTDGRIHLDGRGGEFKSFDVKDGLRIVLARSLGMQVVFLTGRKSDAVSRRAVELSVDRVYQGANDKAAVIRDFIAEEGLDAAEIAYMGDDLPDLPAMTIAGLAGAAADAAPEVREAADWVSSHPGGRGAVREMVEFLLQAQGLWEGAVARYRS
jgi:YrbI family 3-deoxy-D-manno-octulosonate 8-phosphate phosphatase